MWNTKVILRIVAVCFVILPILPNQGQDREYSHPLHDFSFKASPSWKQELHDYNGKVFEVTNPNHNMRVCMSFIPGCKNARKLMKQISDLDGVICMRRPFDTILNQKKAVMMQGTCLKGKEPFRKLFIGITGSDGLYLMEIICPDECYVNHKEQLKTILGSLKVEA